MAFVEVFNGRIEMALHEGSGTITPRPQIQLQAEQVVEVEAAELLPTRESPAVQSPSTAPTLATTSAQPTPI